MDQLMKTIEMAVENNDYESIVSIFTPSSSLLSSSSSLLSWDSIGQGEQRSLSAFLVQQIVLVSPTFLDLAFGNENDNNDENNQNKSAAVHTLIPVLIQALSHLPATVEKAADNILRQRLFDYMIHHHNDNTNETEDDTDSYGTAARLLSGMRMEDDMTSIYYMKPVEKANVYVQIAECFLMEDYIAESDAAVNKAGSMVELIPDKENHPSLILRYKSTYARILDWNRKFLNAATRYHDLSMTNQNNINNSTTSSTTTTTTNTTTTTTNTPMIDDDDLLQMYGRAITCAILAPSSNQRQRVLKHLYHDCRFPLLETMIGYESHGILLQKMFLQQIISSTTTAPICLQQFENSLAIHQKAIMKDGLSILQRGLLEHNIMAISSIYQSIYISEMAYLLDMKDDLKRTEKLITQMILDNIIDGSIDQMTGLLEFHSTTNTKETQEQAYDIALGNFCMELNTLTDYIQQQQQ